MKNIRSRKSWHTGLDLIPPHELGDALPFLFMLGLRATVLLNRTDQFLPLRRVSPFTLMFRNQARSTELFGISLWKLSIGSPLFRGGGTVNKCTPVLCTARPSGCVGTTITRVTLSTINNYRSFDRVICAIRRNRPAPLHGKRESVGEGYAID